MKSSHTIRVPYPLPPGVDLRWIWHYSALVALRERLRGKIGRRAGDAAEEEDSQDVEAPADAGGEIDCDEGLALLGSEEDALTEVEAAIERLSRNSYGWCEATGRRIPAEELHAAPWTRCSVKRPSPAAAPSGPAGAD